MSINKADPPSLIKILTSERLLFWVIKSKQAHNSVILCILYFTSQIKLPLKRKVLDTQLSFLFAFSHRSSLVQNDRTEVQNAHSFLSFHFLPQQKEKNSLVFSQFLSISFSADLKRKVSFFFFL